MTKTISKIKAAPANAEPVTALVVTDTKGNRLAKARSALVNELHRSANTLRSLRHEYALAMAAIYGGDWAERFRALSKGGRVLDDEERTFLKAIKAEKQTIYEMCRVEVIGKDGKAKPRYENPSDEWAKIIKFACGDMPSQKAAAKGARANEALPYLDALAKYLPPLYRRGMRLDDPSQAECNAAFDLGLFLEKHCKVDLADLNANA